MDISTVGIVAILCMVASIIYKIFYKYKNMKRHEDIINYKVYQELNNQYKERASRVIDSMWPDIGMREKSDIIKYCGWHIYYMGEGLKILKPEHLNEIKQVVNEKKLEEQKLEEKYGSDLFY